MANFKSPAQKLIVQTSNFNDESNARFKSVVLEHYYNHSMSLIMPGSVTKSQLEEVASIITDQHYYTTYGVPLSKLIDVEFIEAFVKRGNMYMLSCGTHINTSDICVALHPPGRLVLNVSKDIYTQLGLEGKPSKFNGKRSDSRYIVTIDLTNPSFRPDKKNYKRVEWCFTDRLNLNFRFLVSWVPFDPDVCPSSIGAYFTKCGFKSTHGSCQKTSRRLKQLTVPHIEPSQGPDSVDDGCSGVLEFFEWLGAVACGCELDDPDGYISTYCCPQPNTVMSDDGRVFQLSGFCTPDSLLRLLDKLRELIKTQRLPWISFTVHGFADTPVSWSSREHGYRDNGDNLYTFVLFPNDMYWLYQATGMADTVS
jgi:ribonuclease P/MRP protein subunit RPP40